MTPVDFLLCLGQFRRYEPWGILLFCWPCSKLCPMSHQQKQPLTQIMHSSCLLLCVCLCHQNQRLHLPSWFWRAHKPPVSCKPVPMEVSVLYRAVCCVGLLAALLPLILSAQCWSLLCLFTPCSEVFTVSLKSYTQRYHLVANQGRQ